MEMKEKFFESIKKKIDNMSTEDYKILEFLHNNN